MADEILRIDQNSNNVSGAVTNDVAKEIRNIRVDPSSNALLVTGDLTISEFPAASALTDNFANPTTTVVGSMGMLWDGSAWDRAPGNSTDGTLVNLGANNDVTVTSSALPTGAATLAEQQTQTASLSIIDDWDESDRAKVNLIVGQAGIAGGTGVDGASVPRITLATNVPLPAGTNALGSVSMTLTERTFADSSVSVTTTSGTVVASNASRKGLYITNTSNTNRVSLNVTDDAVLDAGITLAPGATWQMDSRDFTTAIIKGIANATTTVSVMEIT